MSMALKRFIQDYLIGAGVEYPASKATQLATLLADEGFALPKTLPERMRDAADTMEEARKHLGKGYSPEYKFDIETLRSHADRFEFEAAVKGPLIALIASRSAALTPGGAEYIAENIIEKFNLTPKETANVG
ncbi:hypothetical protein JRC04_04645 [Mycolicibacterium sp. S2-37]|uniref:hypothetical protein n=1 Tax=Mycolicibacterium sp. S2-37 TaxID=2810297 RepID=UPI001A953E0B|nr:hypothetical protein [Mycolicibacterium sp. S2-37]MBO0676747.1 hypothetical protein [Mycolicibacterium sp. S2-37]